MGQKEVLKVISMTVILDDVIELSHVTEPADKGSVAGGVYTRTRIYL